MPMMGFSQTPPHFTLEYCQQKAIENFPTTKQIALNQREYKLRKENTQKNYLPSLGLNGTISYQSDVTKVSGIAIPGFSVPVISKDWYKINFDLEQLLWDGGMTKNQQNIETYNYELADQNVKIKTYQFKQQVDVLYFNILFLKENIDVFQLLISDLDARIKEAGAALKNGVLLQTDVDVLEVSKQLARQKLIEKEEDLKGMLASLSELTHLQIQTADQLQIPQMKVSNYEFVNKRPAYQMLSIQQNKLSALKSLSATKRMPVFKAFGQMGYGRPGYDMLNPNFDTYYMIGLRMHWNIWDWGKVKHEAAILDIQREVVNTEKQSFDQNLRAELQQRKAGIQKFEKLIIADQSILSLQSRVLENANNQLKNGTITTTNYLIELNKKIRAQLNLKAHKLQLIFAKYQYIASVGNL